MANKKKAFVRYANNKAVAGSLILADKAPKVGEWREVPTDLCCDGAEPSGPTFTPIELCYGPDPCMGDCNTEIYYLYQDVLFGIPIVKILNSEILDDFAPAGDYRIESNGKLLSVISSGAIEIVSDCA
jgi:hypothetical protein